MTMPFIRAFQVLPRPMFKSSKPVRNQQYLRWIKRFPCVVCNSARLVDPCHTGSRGLGQKSSDLSCIPLCRKHHEEMHKGPADFALKYDLDIPVLIEFFNHLWDLKERKKA